MSSNKSIKKESFDADEAQMFLGSSEFKLCIHLTRVQGWAAMMESNKSSMNTVIHSQWQRPPATLKTQLAKKVTSTS